MLPTFKTVCKIPGWQAALLVLAVSTGLPTQAALTLADKGQSSYRIVIPAAAIPSERYAAQELQRYLEKISGAKLPIVTGSMATITS